MNRHAYRTTGLALRVLSTLIRPRINIHNQHHIPPDNPVIFVVNHFTRAETLLLPYYIDKLTQRTIWSLADHNLFKGGLGAFLEKVGALSNAAPDRDQLIVRSLLTNEAAWIIFPEGRMVKNKKIYDVVNEKGRFVISTSAGKHPPHTGAATLALRTEFYRERLKKMAEIYPDEAARLLERFGIADIAAVVDTSTCLVPVNITYYPIRARENALSSFTRGLFENLSAKAIEELQAESTMLMSDTDIDIRFGEPIPVARFMKPEVIQENIELKAQIGFDDSIAAKKMLRSTAVHLMERYMESIYSMTTVNHDHLFAALLKNLPADRVSEEDLRRRAFLVLTRLARMRSGIFRHTSCTQGQVHLLTDDRHGKYANFLAIAEETGIVRRQENQLIKNREMFVQPDSLQTRVENPVVIIANEVEPLFDLQEAIREVAAEPAEAVRRQTARHLIQQADFQFEKDYANHAVAGESKKKNIGRPFLLRGEEGSAGVVLVHGYMAAPMEVKALARHLNRRGYTVYAPRLAGHGTSPDDLASRSWTEWEESVDAGYAIVTNLCERVYAGGFSMGAGLVVGLAGRVSGLAGVFAVSPPLKLQDFYSNFVPAVHLWNRLLKRIRHQNSHREFVVNQPENPHINYTRNPIAGVAEMGKLMESVEAGLENIRIPALIIQSQADPVVSPAGSRRIFEKIAAADKEYLLVNYARHGIINGEGARRVFCAIDEFLQGGEK